MFITMSSQNTLMLISCLALGTATLSGQMPTDNPITKFYPGLEQYNWTDELAWNTVTQTAAVADDGGDDLQTVQAEIIALSEAGGGVLYFPAGKYDFSDDLIVHDGVVLRGVQPGDGHVADNLDPDRDPANPVDEVDNAKSAQFALETKFEFPRFVFDPTANGGAGNDRTAAFKAIRLHDWAMDSNVGICWIDINRARIEWLEYGEDPETGMATSYWGYFGVDWDPQNDFSGPSNTWLPARSRNWVIFGNRINNAARWDNRPNVSPPVGSQDPWAIWPKRFTAQIDTFNYENNLVANNRLMDKHYFDWDNAQPNGDQPGDSIDDFLMPGYKDKNGNVIGDIWFNYTAGYGIKMNRSIGLDGNDIPYTPDEFPFLYRRGVTCRDNWTFVTRRVAIYLGGDGVECIGNYRIDVSYQDGDLRKQAFVKPVGNEAITFAGNTLENRGVDITGANVKCNYNYIIVYRHRMLETSYYSTDGEGILHQEVGGGTYVDRWEINRNILNAYIGIYKSRDIRRVTLLENVILPIPISGPAAIYVQADTNNGPFSMEDVLIDGNISSSGMNVMASRGVENVVISNNDVTGTISHTRGVILENNEGTLNEYSDPERIPPETYDPLPDGSFIAPADETIVEPGETITLIIQASDGEDAPAAVTVWRNLLKEGDAVPGDAPGSYVLEVTAPEERGTHYYFLGVEGSPDDYWSPPLVLRVQEAPAYEPVGWIETPWGWLYDGFAPWFYLPEIPVWLYVGGYEMAQAASAPGFYFYNFTAACWAYTQGDYQGWAYHYPPGSGWVLYQ